LEINATLLLQLALFLVLLVWLSTFLTAPLMRIYDERERRIEGAADEALKLRDGVSEKAGLVDERLKEANAEARQVLDQLRKKGQEKERELLDAARDKAGGLLEDAQAELFAATEEIRGELKADAEKIAADIAGKVLGRAA
jgi:F-type H+-transporting ATPase subunit b